MSLSILQDRRLHELLARTDGELAQEARDAGCILCGDVVHRSNFKRKVRGIASSMDDVYESRESFCCRVDGCRKRVTPPSVRFLDRRVYVAAVVVLATAMQQGVTPWRASRLKAELGVSRRTLKRWRTWWHSTFPAGDFWRTARGRFAEPVDVSRLPSSLLERFPGSGEGERLLAFLCFLASVPARVQEAVIGQKDGRFGSAEDGQ